MANYWAISIGINQYHYLQPLMQAQNDALALHRFLTEEAGFKAEHSILLSDLAISPQQRVVYPDQQAVQTWLRTVCQQLGPDDVLWLFFSGYGAQTDSEDYLLPVDGDPDRVAKTGVRLRDILALLQQAPTRNIAVMLDMNRSQSALAGQTIGAQTLKLARAAGIPLLLSCQPQQFSHETLAVRHGLFTAALLEGLRYHGCFTLAHLGDYLATRLPELCDHHWRPTQNPVALVPDDKKFLTLLPPSALEKLPAGLDALNDSEDASGNGGRPAAAPRNPEPGVGLDQGYETAVAVETPIAAETLLAPPTPSAPFEPGSEIPIAGPTGDTLSFDLPEETLSEPDVTATVDLPDEPARSRSRTPLGSVGLLALLLLLLGGVLLRDRPFFQTALSRLPDWLPGDGADETSGVEAETTGETAGDEAAGAEAEGAEPEAPAVSAAPTEAAETAEAPAQSPAETAPETAPAAAPADSAIAPSPGSSGSTPAAPPPDPQQSRANAALLAAARQSIEPNQASRFANAIATAQRIRPGEPLYSEAQADIARWSQVIFDLAEGRAASGNLDGAIAAARLVPAAPEAVYRRAQQRIAFWQQRQRSRQIIQQAQQVPRSGQAATYQDGIFRLQQVPAGQPEYATAQGLIDSWSQKMLSIARARAAQGRLEAAVQAAVLIPKGTAAYDQAQADIARWRGQ